MRFDPQAGVTKAPSTNSTRRRGTRFEQDTLQSSLGPVLDISASGVRVKCSRPPTGTIDLEIFDTSEVIVIRSEVVWTKRVGLFKHQAGLRFGQMEASVQQRLARLATDNRYRYGMDHG
jgi:hypothetical protein